MHLSLKSFKMNSFPLLINESKKYITSKIKLLFIFSIYLDKRLYQTIIKINDF